MPSSTDEFALEVKGPGDLTEPLRSVYIEALQDGPCRLAIYAPELTSVPSRHVQPLAAYLLMMFDGCILVAAYSRNCKVTITKVPLDDVLCVELGQILLFCWIKIVFGRNVCQQFKIPFNLVKFDLFRKAFMLMRKTLDEKRESKKFKPLASLDLDFKFTNVLHDLMRPEELLLGIAFQPEVRTRRFIFLERQILPPLVAALTNRQFLLITEESPTWAERLGRFSEIYTYCPHYRVESVVVANESEEFPKLVITLSNESARFVIKGAFSNETMPQFSQLRECESNFLERRDESVLV